MHGKVKNKGTYSKKNYFHKESEKKSWPTFLRFGWIVTNAQVYHLWHYSNLNDQGQNVRRWNKKH